MLQKQQEEPIDLSGPTPPEQNDPMDVDDDRDNTDNNERNREDSENQENRGNGENGKPEGQLEPEEPSDSNEISFSSELIPIAQYQEHQ